VRRCCPVVPRKTEKQPAKVIIVFWKVGQKGEEAHLGCDSFRKLVVRVWGALLAKKKKGYRTCWARGKANLVGRFGQHFPKGT